MTRRLALLAAPAALLAAAAPANVETSILPPGRPADLAILAPGPQTDPAADETAAEPAAPAEDAAPPPPAVPSAILSGLDKFSGQVRRVVAPIGGPTEFERLTVRVQACERGAAGDAAFVTVTDRLRPDAAIFQGWMFAESPALSALDHPRYDVWVLSCSTSSGEAP